MTLYSRELPESSDAGVMLASLRDVGTELVVQPLLGWLAGKGTQMDDGRRYAPLQGAGLDRLALLDVSFGPAVEDDGPPEGWAGPDDATCPNTGQPRQQCGHCTTGVRP